MMVSGACYWRRKVESWVHGERFMAMMIEVDGSPTLCGGGKHQTILIVNAIKYC